MGFTTEQIAQLQANLSPNCIKSREQSGRSLSYIEGWHAIAEANRIFGFDSWSRETIYLKEVARYEVEKKDYKTKAVIGTNWKVAYEAKVRVIVWCDKQAPYTVYREGTGFGQGTMGDLYDAMESAAKEAETDAMKRAMMTFGNPFGLALYDKEQRHVGYTLTEEELKGHQMAINTSTTEAELIAAFNQAKGAGYEIETLTALCKTRKAQILGA